MEMRLSGSVQRRRNAERWEGAGFEDGSLEPLSHYPPKKKKIKNQGLRERIQAKIKSSHCIICIMIKKIPKLYIYMYSIALHWRSKYRWKSESGGWGVLCAVSSRRLHGCSWPRDPASLAPAQPSRLAPGTLLSLGAESSGAGTGTPRLGLSAPWGAAAAPPHRVSSGLPFRV